MPPSSEEMISKVLEELAISGAKGVPISNIFDGLNAYLSSLFAPTIDAAARGNLWRSLVTRDDVQIFENEADDLRSLTFHEILAKGLGQTIVATRTSTQIPNGHLSIQGILPPTITTTPSPENQPSNPSLLKSSEVSSPSPADREDSLDSRLVSRQSEALSLPRTESPNPTPTPQKKGIVRETSRRWTSKAVHTTQEEVDKEEHDKQYAAGISRVYIDPPGSARPDVSQASQSPQPVDGAKATRSRFAKAKEKIVVFKHLVLTDPLWLIKNKGSYKEAYNLRKTELDARQSSKKIPLSKKKNQSSTSEIVTSTLSVASNAFSDARQPGETIAVSRHVSFVGLATAEQDIGAQQHEETFAPGSISAQRVVQPSQHGEQAADTGLNGKPTAGSTQPGTVDEEMVAGQLIVENDQSEAAIVVDSTASSLESSIRKRKAQNADINGAEPPKKRGRPRKTPTTTQEPTTARHQLPKRRSRPSKSSRAVTKSASAEVEGSIAISRNMVNSIPSLTVESLPSEQVIQQQTTVHESVAEQPAFEHLENHQLVTPESIPQQPNIQQPLIQPFVGQRIIAQQAIDPQLIDPQLAPRKSAIVTDSPPGGGSLNRLTQQSHSTYHSPYPSLTGREGDRVDQTHPEIDTNYGSHLTTSTPENRTALSQNPSVSAERPPAFVGTLPHPELPPPMLYSYHDSHPGYMNSHHMLAPYSHSEQGLRTHYFPEAGPQSITEFNRSEARSVAAHGNIYDPSPHFNTHDWNACIPPPYTGVNFQVQPQGPQYNSNSEQTPHQNGSTAVLPPQDSFIPINKRRRAKERGFALMSNEAAGSQTSPPQRQTINKATYKPKLLADLEAMEDTLSRFAAEAEAIEISNVAARLFVSYDNVVGNLLLSEDRSHLLFRALNRDFPESSSFVVPVAQVLDDPIVSMKGSRPMELRAKYRDNSDDEVVCRFFVGQSEAAYRAANEMRASIVRARIICKHVSGETNSKGLFRNSVVPNIDVVKPHKCEICSKRFKNKEGIKYHLEKSQTTCNPDFVGPAEKPKRKQVSKPRPQPKPARNEPPRKRKKTVDFNEGGLSRDRNTTQTTAAPLVAEDLNSTPLADDEDDSSDSVHDSDDSIFEWAEKVAFVNPGESVRSGPSTSRKHALKKSIPKRPQVKGRARLSENDMLQQLVDGAADATPDEMSLDATVDGILQELVEEVVTCDVLQQQCKLNHGFALHQAGGDIDDIDTSDVINIQRSKSILLDLVDESYGMFPGEGGIWIAFVAVWLQKHSRSGSLPSFNLCDKALSQLIQEQKLVSTPVPVIITSTLTKTRTILSTPAAEVDPEALEMMKELIRLAYPRHYVPSRFSPSKASRERLEDFMAQTSPLSQSRIRLKLNFNPQSRELTPDSDYEYGSGDEQSSPRSDDIDDSEELESDGWINDQRRQESLSGRKGTSLTELQWATVIAMGDSDLVGTPNSCSTSGDGEGTPDTTNGSDPGRYQFGRLKAKPRGWQEGKPSPEEKERREINNLRHSALTTFQDEKSGAWNQAPFPVPKLELPRTKMRRYALPEPITYFQSENGAWDTRAYGHGVKPLFARPQRRADGNPNLQAYLRRIDEGFRPVLMPQGNRQFLPAAPSVNLLGTAKPKQPRQYKKSVPKDGARPRNKMRKRVPIIPMGDEEAVDVPLVKKSRKRKVSFAPPELGRGTPEAETLQPKAKRQRAGILKKKNQVAISADDEDPDFNPMVGHLNSVPLLTRRAARGGQDIDEIQKLGYLKPRALADIESSPNVGLTTLPASFWDIGVGNGKMKPSQVYNTIPGLAGIEKVKEWEQGPTTQEMLANRTAASEGVWVHHTVDAMESAFDTEMMKLKWEPMATFQIENLPYDDLDDVEDFEFVDVPAPKKPQKTIATKQRRPTSKNLTSRRLSAWPTDFDGVLDNISTVRQDLGVEVAPILQTRQTRSLNIKMSDDEEHRLIVAIIAISVLTGGLTESTDWVLVANLFPRFSANFINKTWRQVANTSKPLIETMTSEFQDAFLPAYQNNEVPRIDYNDLVGYDWPGLIDWATKKMPLKRPTKSIHLPNSRKEMKKVWEMTEQDSGADKAKEMFYNPKLAIYKRLMGSAAFAYTYPSEALQAPKNANDIEIDEMALARSWIKSLVLTPEADYDIEVARTKLRTVGDDLVQDLRKILVAERVIKPTNKGRATPGRAFQSADAFFNALNKSGSQKLYIDAVEFKRFLDTEFASGKDCVRHDYHANEGAMLCITNLQAHGRIMLKGINIPMNEMGLTGGGYETRKISKTVFRFELDIYPAASYIYDKDIAPLQIIEFLEPPRGGSTGETPIWYGVTDKLIQKVWKQVLTALSTLASLRSGITVGSLEKILRPALEEWEIWRFFEWGVKVGLVKRKDDSCEGWVMEEWWWAVVGKYCALIDDP